MSIKEVQLDFENLAELDDGRINTLMKRQIMQIAQDCMNRPAEETSRKLQLDFSVKPVMDQDGNCDYVKVEIECKTKLPTYRSRPYEMRVTKSGLLFNADFPDQLDQQPLFPNEEKDE